MATTYLMSNGTTYVTFTPTGGVGNNGNIYLSCGYEQVITGASYKCTYNCPNGSSVSCTSSGKWGWGTVWDCRFQVGDQTYEIGTSSFTKSFPASGYTSIGFGLNINSWNSYEGSAYVRVNSPSIYVTYTSTYTLTVRAGTGISGVSGGGTYNEGTSKQITATVATGYTWSKWVYTSGGSQYTTTQNPTLTVNSNIDLTAQATANTFYIAYNNNGGSGSMSSTTATYGTYVTLRANTFTKDKYIFKGWATSANGSKVYDNQQQILASSIYTSSGATVTLYAVWEKDPNAVFVNSTKVYTSGWK